MSTNRIDIFESIKLKLIREGRQRIFNEIRCTKFAKLIIGGDRDHVLVYNGYTHTRTSNGVEEQEDRL